MHHAEIYTGIEPYNNSTSQTDKISLITTISSVILTVMING